MVKNVIKKIILWIFTVFIFIAAIGGIVVFTSTTEKSDKLFSVAFSIILFAAAFLFFKKARKPYKKPDVVKEDGVEKEETLELTVTNDSEEKEDSVIIDDFYEEEYTPKNAEITFIDAEALEFWNKKRTDFEIPPYYSNSVFGRNVKSSLDRLLDGGYLEIGDVQSRVYLKTIPELKAILAEHELKTTGNKNELVYRLINNLDEYVLEEMFPVGIYKITDKGIKAIEPYSIVRDNKKYGLGLSDYRLLKEKEEHPEENNTTILYRVLSEIIHECYIKKDIPRYQLIITTASRFMLEIGESMLCFEYSALSFFVYLNQNMENQYVNNSPQEYYMVKNLEKAAQNCGYSFDEMILNFCKVIKETNPFNLATNQKIEKAMYTIKKVVGI